MREAKHMAEFVPGIELEPSRFINFMIGQIFRGFLDIRYRDSICGFSDFGVDEVVAEKRLTHRIQTKVQARFSIAPLCGVNVL
jgi:hypothetical protein